MRAAVRTVAGYMGVDRHIDVRFSDDIDTNPRVYLKQGVRYLSHSGRGTLD